MNFTGLKEYQVHSDTMHMAPAALQAVTKLPGFNPPWKNQALVYKCKGREP